MTETPKCPYCGGNMEPHSIHGNQGEELCWYSCRECEAISPNKKTKEEARAAALRRAEPENRVLGLGEAQRICAKGDAVWLEEMKTITATQLTDIKLAHVSFLDEQNDACYIHTFFVKFPIMAEKYGKTWRCWLRKPTPEEMEREKWEE